jgi:hypothetical protein
MPTTDFASEILETEIVLTHIEDGHVYHFPILSNDIVSLHGSRIEANPKAKCEGSKYLLDARDAAQSAPPARARASDVPQAPKRPPKALCWQLCCAVTVLDFVKETDQAHDNGR